MNRATLSTPTAANPVTYLWFNCPGCKTSHMVTVNGPDTWKFNGDLEKPTLEPSVLATWYHGDKNFRCHSHVKAGRIEFLSDCTHELRGQTVELPEAPTI